MTTTSKPVEKISVGSITASIFRNEGKDGKPFFKTAFENRYRQDGEWKTTGSYSQHDLVNLTKAALLAHSAIVKLNRSEQPEEEPQPGEADAA